MISLPSSNFDQRFDPLEASLGLAMHEIQEFIASVSSLLN
jgi:hypothetical protein